MAQAMATMVVAGDSLHIVEKGFCLVVNCLTMVGTGFIQLQWKMRLRHVK
jgi:hypothetical protein